VSLRIDVESVRPALAVIEVVSLRPAATFVVSCAPAPATPVSVFFGPHAAATRARAARLSILFFIGHSAYSIGC
jgi:hypothetical protein